MTKPPSRFNTIAINTWHHLDFAILIGLAIYFAIGGLIGISADILNPVIVAMLSVLAISQLRSRSQVADVAATWHRTRTDLFSPVFPPEYTKAQSTVSHSYFYTGATMMRTMANMSDHIPRILRNDGSVRILLPDPNNEQLLAMIAATHPDKTVDDIRLDIENSLRIANRLRSDKGTLEIRTTQFVPSIGINAMDLAHPTKSIMVQMYEFIPQQEIERAPIFYLTNGDRTWFAHFEAQIRRLWESGEDYLVELQ